MGPGTEGEGGDRLLAEGSGADESFLVEGGGGSRERLLVEGGGGLDSLPTTLVPAPPGIEGFRIKLFWESMLREFFPALFAMTPALSRLVMGGFGFGNEGWSAGLWDIGAFMDGCRQVIGKKRNRSSSATLLKRWCTAASHDAPHRSIHGCMHL